jgi:predicted MarR family transcription regulator
MSPPWACGLLAFYPARQADRPLHPADVAKYIDTPDTSRAAHHVRRAEKAGLMRKVGSFDGWVAMTPEVSVSLFRRLARVMTSPARL